MFASIILQVINGRFHYFTTRSIALPLVEIGHKGNTNYVKFQVTIG